MKLLALESTVECSAALYLDGACRELRAPSGSRHGERLLDLVDALLVAGDTRLGQLDAIAFDRGPGAFTALRIAAGAAQGLALGADLPVLPVSSLAALAHEAAASRVLTALDARMGELYWAAFRKDGRALHPETDECLVRPEQAPIPEGAGWHGVGNGFTAHAATLRQRLGSALAAVAPAACPSAAAVARLAAEHYRRGAGLDAEHALPVYLRAAVAVMRERH